MNYVVLNYVNCNLISVKKEKVLFDIYFFLKYLIN